MREISKFENNLLNMIYKFVCECYDNENLNQILKGENNNMNMGMDFGNMFNGMFKPIARGYCKISMNGKLAIKTTNGYKTYDVEKNRLTNCDNFAFDMDGAFWVIPTMKVERGDIILVNGKPRCVIEVGKNSIKTFSYDNSTIDELVPEHHVFMGKSYCYGKIFSPFMNMGKGNNMSNMMRMMMMNQMLNGGGSNNAYSNVNGMFNPMMFMMMGNGNNDFFNGMFDGAFDFGTSDDEDEANDDVKED